MTKFLISMALIMSFFSALSQETTFKQVNSVEFQKLIEEKNGVLLDVRTRMEFKNGHINNSGNLNFYTLSFSKKLDILPKEQAIYLYCNTGYRSEKTARMLIEKGFEKVYNLQHGIMEWELQDLPLIVDPDARPDIDNKMEPKQYYSAINSESLVFIDFYAPWCGPCQKIMPMIDSLKVEYHKDMNIIKVNVDASKKLVKELMIGSVPYLVLFDNGEIVFSNNGSITRNKLTKVFDSNIEKHGKSLAVLKKN